MSVGGGFSAISGGVCAVRDFFLERAGGFISSEYTFPLRSISHQSAHPASGTEGSKGFDGFPGLIRTGVTANARNRTSHFLLFNNRNKPRAEWRFARLG